MNPVARAAASSALSKATHSQVQSSTGLKHAESSNSSPTTSALTQHDALARPTLLPQKQPRPEWESRMPAKPTRAPRVEDTDFNASSDHTVAHVSIAM